MTESNDGLADLLDRPALSQQDAAEAFRKALERLGETQSGIASRMQRLNDPRPFNTILRGIQRMAAGDARVSGEMQVILEMMTMERRRAKYEASKLSWTSIIGGCVTTKTRDFTITLSPQSRSRWHINLMHVDGYSPPWPTWQTSLEEAKIKALFCLDEALAELQRNQEWNEKIKAA